MTKVAARASSEANRAPSEPHSWYRVAGAHAGAARAPRPATGAAALTAPPSPRAGVTYLRCGGCGASAVYAQSKQGYGRLVHGFLDRHEHCGNAVEISAARNFSTCDEGASRRGEPYGLGR
jgi:hypothetical protein